MKGLKIFNLLNRKSKKKEETSEEIIDEELEIIRKYNKEFNSANKIRNYIPWKYAQCMIEDVDEVLFSMWYRNPCHKNGAAPNYSIIFHIVKNSEGIFLKYMSLRKVEEIEERYAYEAMDNLWVYQTRIYGVMQKGYKDYIRTQLMKTIKLNEEEFLEKINNLKDIKYESLEYFDCEIEYECIDYCDYINKKYFYTDGYCLDKYKACIKFVDYILEKCTELKLSKTNIKLLKEEEKIKILKDLINRKKKIEEEFFYCG